MPFRPFNLQVGWTLLTSKGWSAVEFPLNIDTAVDGTQPSSGKSFLRPLGLAEEWGNQLGDLPHSLLSNQLGIPPSGDRRKVGSGEMESSHHSKVEELSRHPRETRGCCRTNIKIRLDARYHYSGRRE